MDPADLALTPLLELRHPQRPMLIHQPAPIAVIGRKLHYFASKRSSASGATMGRARRPKRRPDRTLQDARPALHIFPPFPVADIRLADHGVPSSAGSGAGGMSIASPSRAGSASKP